MKSLLQADAARIWRCMQRRNWNDILRNVEPIKSKVTFEDVDEEEPSEESEHKEEASAAEKKKEKKVEWLW